MSNSENMIQTIKTTIQDMVAPDVRELKTKMDLLTDQMSRLDKTFERAKRDALSDVAGRDQSKQS